MKLKLKVNMSKNLWLKKKMGSNDIYVSEILKKDDELDLSISLSQLIG